MRNHISAGPIIMHCKNAIFMRIQQIEARKMKIMIFPNYLFFRINDYKRQ